MFSHICPDVYRWLRERSGLTQKQLAAKLHSSRSTIHAWETGKTRPDRDKERDLLDAVQWAREPFVELVCEKLSLFLGRRVAIMPQHEERYLPTSPFSQAEALLRTHYARIPARLRKALIARINSVRLHGAQFERDNMELEELMSACIEILARKPD